MQPDEPAPAGGELDPHDLLDGLVYAAGLAYMLGLPVFALRQHERHHGAQRPVTVAPTLPPGTPFGQWGTGIAQGFQGMRSFAPPPGTRLPPPPAVARPSASSSDAVQTLIALGVDASRAESIAATLGPEGVASIAGMPKMLRNMMLKMVEASSTA